MRAIALAAALAATLTAPAFAQRGLFDYADEAGLGNAEFEALTAAEVALAQNDEAGAGAVETWRTAAASGEARVVERAPRADGRPCVVFRHTATRADTGRESSFPGRRCQAPDGRWLISVE